MSESEQLTTVRHSQGPDLPGNLSLLPSHSILLCFPEAAEAGAFPACAGAAAGGEGGRMQAAAGAAGEEEGGGPAEHQGVSGAVSTRGARLRGQHSAQGPKEIEKTL